MAVGPRVAAAESQWIIEGVYGWLAEVALPRATSLIWLDMPWNICREGLSARGLRRDATKADHVALQEWAEAYRRRKTSSSFAGHLALFEISQKRKSGSTGAQRSMHFLAASIEVGARSWINPHAFVQSFAGHDGESIQAGRDLPFPGPRETMISLNNLSRRLSHATLPNRETADYRS